MVPERRVAGWSREVRGQRQGVQIAGAWGGGGPGEAGRAKGGDLPPGLTGGGGTVCGRAGCIILPRGLSAMLWSPRSALAELTCYASESGSPSRPLQPLPGARNPPELHPSATTRLRC